MTREEEISNLVDEVAGDVKSLKSQIINVQSNLVSPLGEIRGSGRIYAYADNRWVTNSDDNYGTNYYQHQGDIILPGTIIKSLTVITRATDDGVPDGNGITDMSIKAIVKHPDPITRWETGVDSDGEVSVDDIYSFKMMDAATGNVNDMHMRTVAIEHEVLQASLLSLYFKPEGARTATDYIQFSYMFQLQYPGATGVGAFTIS